MASYRVDRANQEIKNELNSLIANRLSDPRLHNSVISVTRVQTTPDMKYAKVYVAIFEDEPKRTELFKLLETTSGFLRKNIASVLNTKFTPQLVFELDDSMDNAMHIEALLNQIKKNEYNS